MAKHIKQSYTLMYSDEVINALIKIEVEGPKITAGKVEYYHPKELERIWLEWINQGYNVVWLKHQVQWLVPPGVRSNDLTEWMLNTWIRERFEIEYPGLLENSDG